MFNESEAINKIFEDDYFHRIRAGHQMKIPVSTYYCGVEHKKNRRDFVTIINKATKNKPIINLLEIGTHEGLSSAFLSQFCQKITTIDINDYPMKYKTWYDLGVKNKIDFIHVLTDGEKRNLLKDLDFDFAFVDGDHHAGVLLDWELVKHCGRVLFHDYHVTSQHHRKMYSELTGIVDSLPKDEVTIIEPLAYWEKKQ